MREHGFDLRNDVDVEAKAGEVMDNVLLQRQMSRARWCLKVHIL